MLKSLLLLAAFSVAGVMLAFAYPALLPRLTSLGIDEVVREDIWRQALLGIREHPLFGVGALGYAFLTGGPYPHAHDIPLEMLVSFGIAGTLFISAYFAATLRDAAKLFRASPNREIYALVFAAAAVTLVHGIGDVTVLWPQTGMLLALALAGGAVRENRTAPAAHR